MTTTKLLGFAIANLLMLNVSISPVFAKAPTTPKILFASTRDGNRDVFIMNPDGSEQVNLTQHPADDQEAIWSPTGEQILFASNRERPVWGSWDLYLMDPDGSNVRRVFKRKAEIDRNHPTWSPDGKQIAYGSNNWDANKYPIYIATLGEQDEEELGMDGLFPAWSPDGTEIACMIWGRITFINLRTHGKKRLLPRKAMAYQYSPSWSAAGDKLVFAWNNTPLPPDRKPGDAFPPGWEDKYTIYIINRDGTGLKQLVDKAGPRAASPVLSPNGEEILYTQDINGDFQIFKLDVNSGVQTQLTHISWNTGGDWFDPAYALSVAPQPHLLTTTWGKVKK